MGCYWIAFCTLEPEAQAAWAQAILSFLAILFAVLLPTLQQRRKRVEDADRLLHLANEVFEKGEELLTSLGDYSGQMSMNMWGKKTDWTELHDAIRSIDMAQLPHPAFISPLIDLRETVAGYVEFYGNVLDWLASPGREEDFDDSILKGYLYRTENVWNSFVAAYEQLTALAFRSKWKTRKKYTDENNGNF